MDFWYFQNQPLADKKSRCFSKTSDKIKKYISYELASANLEFSKYVLN